MKAILDGDRIVKFCIDGGVEVGKPPRGVGIERLRWDGEKLVDLATLKDLWVSVGKGHGTAGETISLNLAVTLGDRLDFSFRHYGDVGSALVSQLRVYSGTQVGAVS